MSNDVKMKAIEELRAAFLEFTNKMLQVQGAVMQKQQAFLRFDEGHMWMQNAIITYEEPKAE